MKTTRRRFLNRVSSSSAGIILGANSLSNFSSCTRRKKDELSKQRELAKNRKRRIILNNDGNDYPSVKVTPESFLNARTNGLEQTQVDSIFYCTGVFNLYTHNSKESEIEWLMGHGFTVLVPDLLGTGELGNGSLKGDAYIGNISYNMCYTAMLVGRSIVGIRTADVVKLSRLLKQKEGIDIVYGIAREDMSAVLLHAAAFDPVISRVTLVNPYSSYRSFVINRFYEPRFVYSLVPGALTAYDLPDLAASLSPGKLAIAGVTDARGQANPEETEADLQVIKDGYKINNANNQLEILSEKSVTYPGILFREWTSQ